MSIPSSFDEYTTSIRHGYYPLYQVLVLALGQAMNGKGAERHASGEGFMQQPILTIARQVGHGFCRGQAMKKLLEADRLPADRAEQELLGAIVYIAADILHLREVEER